MKKIFLVILALTVLLPSAVVYAEGADDWEINYVGAEKEEKRYAEFDYDNKTGGEASIKVVYDVKPKDETKYLELKNPLSGEMKSGSYTLSFMGLGSLSSYTEISVSDVNIFSHKNDMTAEVQDNGWTKFSVTFDYTQQENNFVAFRFYRSIAGLYIDDVALTVSGSDENLIVNGGFEGSGDSVQEDIPYDTTGYRPKNVLCSPGNGMIDINWRNPSTDELVDVKLYDITDGEVLLSDDISTIPNAIINYPITEVGDGTRYYKIVFTYRTKPEFTYYTGGAAASGLDSYIDTWKIRRIRSAETSYCPAEAVVDSDVARTGNASLKLVSNIDRTLANLQKSTYIGVQFEAPLKAGKKFRIKFCGKSKNADYQLLTVTMQGSSWKSRYTTDIFKGTTDDWVEYSFDHESIGEDGLFLVYEGGCEGLWLDDFEIYEIDGSGEIVSGNLLTDGGFENLVKKNDILPGLDAEEGVGEVKLAWSKIPSDCENVNLYVKTFENWDLVANVPKGMGEITLSNLKKGAEYLFRIVPEYKYGYEGNGTEVSVTTVLPEFEIFDSVLTKNGEEVNEADGAGDYVLTTKLKNNLIEDGVQTEHFVAVYNDKEELVIFKSAKNLIAKTAVSAKPVTITESFELPEGEYRVEVFVLDSRSNLNILRDCQVFE